MHGKDQKLESKRGERKMSDINNKAKSSALPGAVNKPALQPRRALSAGAGQASLDKGRLQSCPGKASLVWVRPQSRREGRPVRGTEK